MEEFIMKYNKFKKLKRPFAIFFTVVMLFSTIPTVLSMDEINNFTETETAETIILEEIGAPIKISTPTDIMPDDGSYGEDARSETYIELMEMADNFWDIIVTVGPAGCNYIDLQTAINEAVDEVPTIIVLTADVVTTKTITIGAAKIIKLTGGVGGPYAIDAKGGNFSVITNNGELWLENIIVTGAKKTSFYSDGSGVYNTGTFVMLDGAVISDNTAHYRGGGVYNHTNSAFTMKGGKISRNAANFCGGGYNNTNVTFIM